MRFFAMVGVGILLAGGAAWWGMGATAQPGLPYDNPASVARGKLIYADNCATCHGVNLEGAPDWRTRDAEGMMPAPPHSEHGHTWHHPDTALIAITKLGTEKVVGQGYRSNMPGFGDVLDDQQIDEVLAYIKSTWPARVIDMHNSRNAGG